MEPVLVKISGGLTDNPDAVASIVSYVKHCREASQPVVLVHGGGKQINALSQQLNLDIIQLEGRRVTNREAMNVLLYTVGGSGNAGLVSVLRKERIESVGLTGADAGLTTSRRREPLSINGKSVDFQLVGEIESVNPKILMLLLDNDIVPVVGCLTWSEDDGMLNINADTFAIKIASALGCKELVMLMEPEAVLDESGKPVDSLTSKERDNGVEQGWIKDGMIPKLHTGFQAIESGITQVRLTNPTGLLNGRGTLLRSN
ncbi:MAG: acetylglutamate kinase [Balneolales bacterium]|nr:acetylglutamate kinase [Balneolales bacterium]